MYLVYYLDQNKSNPKYFKKPIIRLFINFESLCEGIIDDIGDIINIDYELNSQIKTKIVNKIVNQRGICLRQHVYLVIEKFVGNTGNSVSQFAVDNCLNIEDMTKYINSLIISESCKDII